MESTKHINSRVAAQNTITYLIALLKNRDAIALFLAAITIQAMVLSPCPAQGYRDPHGKGTRTRTPSVYFCFNMSYTTSVSKCLSDDKYFEMKGVIINYNSQIRTVIIACYCVVQQVTASCTTDRHASHSNACRSARRMGSSTLTRAAAILLGARTAASSTAAKGFEKRA
jgi:hypothetical protein